MSSPVTARSRSKIPIAVQVRVFFRDRWLCRWCHRPTVFAPTFRLLQRFVEANGHQGPLAYFDPRWRRDAAPLLDHMAAVVDHVKAFATGGEDADRNFATACCKCNARKSSRAVEAYLSKNPGKPVRGKFGEPHHWDGLASLFLVLAAREQALTSTEKAWERELRAFVASRRA